MRSMTQTGYPADGMPLSTTDATSLRFLVVDDNDDIRELLVHMVGRLGHSADRACDGIEAVEAMERQMYDFMLLDLSMPRMNGEDVLHWVTDHPERTAGLRVVVLSAWAGPRTAALEELGAYAVLPKPLRGQQLHDMVCGVR